MQILVEIETSYFLKTSAKKKKKLKCLDVMDY